MRTSLVLRILALFLLAGQCARGQVPSLPGTAAKPEERAKVSALLDTDTLQPGQQGVLAIVLDVAPGFHAQSDKPLNPDFIATAVTLTSNPAVTTYAPVFPAAQIENFPLLGGKISVFTGRTIIYVPIEVTSKTSGPLKLAGEIRLQICDDKQCYLPETKPILIETSIEPPGSRTAPPPTIAGLDRAVIFRGWDPANWVKLARPVAASTQKNEVWGLDLAKQGYVLIFAMAFVVGMIFNIVPCVLPVLPLKAIGFYEVSQHNRGKCLAFGAVFSAGLVASFGVLGLIVVVMRWLDWGQLFANAYFLSAIVLILLAMGVSMFGIFEVGLPTAVYSLAPRHDTYTGNFLFGILTAILSTPCTFGMFLGLLIWAAGQPPLLGLSLVMMVGVGMAAPYFFLSAFPELARKLPRTGPWSLLVKQMMGFLLILSAGFFARRFIQLALGEQVYWWFLFTIVLAAGLFLIIRTIQFSPTARARIIAGVLALLMVAPAGAFVYRVTNPPIAWKEYTPAALESARKNSSVVMVEFTAAWCSTCIALETTVFHDPQAVAAIKQYKVVTLRADLTKTDAPGWEILKKVSGVGGIPLTAIYAPGSAEPVRLSGLYSTQDLVSALKEASAVTKVTRLP
jgi:thiol:disulfide interchange protein DsbD